MPPLFSCFFHVLAERRKQVDGQDRRRTHFDPGEAGAPAGGSLPVHRRQRRGRTGHSRYEAGCAV